MISSDNRRYAYGKSQLIEVICQLRFPTILSIDTREPADFQETVRAAFPRYQCQVEKLPGVNGAPARTVNNHTFISEDGGYKLSLTKALSPFPPCATRTGRTLPPVSTSRSASLSRFTVPTALTAWAFAL